MAKEKPTDTYGERVFRVSLTDKDQDIKTFKEQYPGNWSEFVREAIREKMQRERVMSQIETPVKHQPKILEPTGQPGPVTQPKPILIPKEPKGLGNLRLNSIANLTETEIKEGLLILAKEEFV